MLKADTKNPTIPLICDIRGVKRLSFLTFPTIRYLGDIVIVGFITSSRPRRRGLAYSSPFGSWHHSTRLWYRLTYLWHLRVFEALIVIQPCLMGLDQSLWYGDGFARTLV